MNEMKIYLNNWRNNPQCPESCIFMLAEMGKEIYHNEQRSHEDIGIYQNAEEALWENIALIQNRAHHYIVHSNLKQMAKDLIVAYEEKNYERENLEEYENDCIAFNKNRHRVELAYQILWQYARDHKDNALELLSEIRNFLDEVDQIIIFKREIVADLQDIQEENPRLDHDFFWWVKSSSQTSYMPQRLFFQYTTQYLQDKIYDQKVDMQLFQLFRDVDLLDTVYQMENGLILEKMNEEQHSFFNVLNHQPVAMAASTESTNYTNLTWSDIEKKYKIQTFVQSKDQPQICFTIKGEKIPNKLCIGAQKFTVQYDKAQGTYCEIDRSTLQKIMQESILIKLEFTDDIITLSPCI